MKSTHTPKTILITGGAGFIGTNFIHYVASNYPDVAIINLDALTYAGNLAGLRSFEQQTGGRYFFFHGDIRDGDLLEHIFTKYDPDTVVNFAAESHVDRSIDSPLQFIETNVLGTAQLLHVAEKTWKNRRNVRFHHVSTDEVFGSLGDEGYFTEETKYCPSSPYSASKAASDHIVRAWMHTYDLPVTISNCSNNYGPWQFPEKLIPLLICNALQGKPLPIYGDGKNVRDWLYVYDHCAAIWTILTCAECGESFNIGGRSEYSNLDLANLLCDILGELRPPSSRGYRDLVVFVADRPGHDLRYAIDCSKIENRLGWSATVKFEEGLRRTVQWYLDNQWWVETICRENPATGEVFPNPE